MKKILAMLLVLAMAFTMVSAVAENNDEHMLIYGTATEIGGDFAPDAWWTNNATDKMIRELMDINRNMTYPDQEILDRLRIHHLCHE